MRGVAIIQVMAVHFTRDRPQVALAIGVDVFFVLSGFLITKLVLTQLERNEGGGGWRPFMRRRLARIYPALVVVCGAFLVTGTLLFSKSAVAVIAEVLASLTFTYPLLAAARVEQGLMLLPMWSLSVEVWFYIVWSAFLLLVVRRYTARRLRFTLMTLVTLCLTVQVIRAVSYADVAVVLHRLRVDLFGIGAAWAIFGSLRGWVVPRIVRLLAGAVLPLLVLTSLLSRPFPYDVDAGARLLPEPVARFFGPWGGPGFTLAMWSVGAFVLVVFCGEQSRTVAILAWRPLVFMGLISYSIYLWHYPLSWLVYEWGPTYLQWDVADVDLLAASLYFAVCAVLSTAVGWVSYRFVELRFMNLGQTAGRSGRVLPNLRRGPG